MSESTSLGVITRWDESPLPVGQARVTCNHGCASTTFLYDTAYLTGNGIAIDPALPLVTGLQYQEGLVRAFRDSSPDCWGRRLLKKAERARAQEHRSTPHRQDELDLPLGVSDDRGREHPRGPARLVRS